MASREIALGSAEAFAGKAAVERGLVEMCRRGDAEAFARLVALHESMVYNLSARLLGDGEGTVNPTRSKTRQESRGPRDDSGLVARATRQRGA